MGGAHRHGPALPAGADLDAEVPVGTTARRVLLAVLAVLGVLTVAGTVALWPDDRDRPEQVDFLAEGVTRAEGTVVSVGEPCPVVVADPSQPTQGQLEEFPEGCNELVTQVVGGPEDGEQVRVSIAPQVARSGLREGDELRLLRLPPREDSPPTYSFVSVSRSLPIGVLSVLFVVVVAVVARLRGVLALVGLGFAGAVIGLFMLPALLAGGPALPVALVGSGLIMYVVLYLAHGLSVRTSTALAGTLFGIAVTAVIGLWGVGEARLSGVSDDTGELLTTYADGLDFQGLLTAAIIVAGLGVLNDVTITQSSAVWELRAAAPDLPRRRLMASGMRIGRDHIASTIYTIVFVYAGTAMAVLLLLSLYDRPVLDLLSDEAIAEEAVRTLASAIGLVLSVPATTAIAVLTVGPPRPEPQAAGRLRKQSA